MIPSQREACEGGGEGQEGGKGVREAAHRIDLLRAARGTAKGNRQGEKGDASISFPFFVNK